MTDNKLLLVTTSFPPTGGPGVQRNLKFCKYWPEFGWKPFVLTTKEIHFPLKDYTLLCELSEEVEIVRTETFDPRRIFFTLKKFFGKSKNAGKDSDTPKVKNAESSIVFRTYKFIQRWFFIPDVGILWLPFAVFTGAKTVRRENIDVVVASCPGASNIIIARIIAAISRKKWVIDFRDGWIDYPYHEYPTKVHLWLNQYLEKKYLTKADKFITYGTFLTNKLVDRYNLSRDKFIEIPNGFDPDDFTKAKVIPKPDEDKFHIVHSGNIYSHRKEPFENLVKAFLEINPSTRNKVVFDLIGSCYDGAQEWIEDLGLKSNFNFLGYMNHGDALNYLKRGDATLILLPVGDFAAFTGKVFEYIALGKFIMEIGEPEGSCGRLLEDIMPAKAVAYPTNVEEIKEVLLNVLKHEGFNLSDSTRTKFSRKSQARQFSAVINNIVR